MLGTAITAILLSISHEKTGTGPSVSISDRRFITRARESAQLTPWQRKVAHATPATPMENAFTNKISTATFAADDTARNRNGVPESPRAEKIPVAIL